MRIVSSFKDYYDYVGHQYGIDDKIVYNRNRLSEDMEIKVDIKKRPIDTRGKDLFYKPSSSLFDYKWLIVAGLSYLIVQRIRTVLTFPPIWEVYTDSKHSDIQLSPLRWFKPMNINSLVGRQDNLYRDLCISLGQPVFMVNGVRYFKSSSYLLVDSCIPHLGNLGFASLVEPTKVFQDISHYLTDVISQSADVAPPITIPDRDQIIAKGFDLKQSFRHRKP